MARLRSCVFNKSFFFGLLIVGMLLPPGEAIKCYNCDEDKEGRLTGYKDCMSGGIPKPANSNQEVEATCGPPDPYSDANFCRQYAWIKNGEVIEMRKGCSEDKDLDACMRKSAAATKKGDCYSFPVGIYDKEMDKCNNPGGSNKPGGSRTGNTSSGLNAIGRQKGSEDYEVLCFCTTDFCNKDTNKDLLGGGGSGGGGGTKGSTGAATNVKWNMPGSALLHVVAALVSKSFLM